MQKHEWLVNGVDTASANLAEILTKYEEQGWEVFQIIPREGEKVWVVIRRPK